MRRDLMALTLVATATIALAQSTRPALAQQASMGSVNAPGRLSFAVPSVTEPIVIDGVISDPGWLQATTITLPFETAPGENTEAPVATECRVAHDAQNLYFSCRASDPDPNNIRAYITDRDDIDQHDMIGITIDPFNDARRAFEFGVSPLGVQTDGVFNQQSGDIDRSWDAIWHSAGQITADGYVVEAAIPFRSLRFPAAGGEQTWGLYAWRRWPRSENVELRSMTLDRNDGCMLCQANLIHGFAGIAPGLNVELIPTITASRAQHRDDLAAPIQTGDIDAQPGLDLRWGLTSDIQLNSTINPDFSQVEADAAQVEVNNRFALFFPEKRPFFLEGADLFNTPLQAVFTRTIADPIVGSKITGKSGANALGVMVARDDITNLVFPANQGSSSTTLDQGATSVIARYRRDVGGSSTVGALFTGREGEDYHNRVAGVDGFIRPWAPLTLDFQFLRSQTQYPDSTAVAFSQVSSQFEGNAARVRASYQTRNWRIDATVGHRDRTFRADHGFMNQVDTRTINAWGQRIFRGRRGHWFSTLRFNGGTWYTETTAGLRTEQGVWANMEYNGPAQTSFWFNPDRVIEYYNGQTFRLTRFWSGWNFRPSGRIGIGMQFNAGDAVDLTNTQKAFQLTVRPSLDLRAGRNLDVRLSHSLVRFSKASEQIFTSNISQMRTVYNISTRAFLRAIVQYRRTNRNPALHLNEVNRRSEGLLTQFLFSYKVNPQTVAFIGYGDTRSGVITEQFDRTPLTVSNRALFVKFGYDWRP